MTNVTAIDLAAWLARRITPSMFVVVKIDIEGAEYAVIDHLIATGAICLIDEMWVEFHHDRDHGAIRKARPGQSTSWGDAVSLSRQLNEAGTYVHAWRLPIAYAECAASEEGTLKSVSSGEVEAGHTNHSVGSCGPSCCVSRCRSPGIDRCGLWP